MKYSSKPIEQNRQSIGVLLVNLGTPDAPDAPSVRRYLKQFLGDPRVVETPRWLWWIILNLVILQIRPSRSAKAYQQVWTDDGSPILQISKKQAAGLQAILGSSADSDINVELAMRYGNPSIYDALLRLQDKGISRLLVLPLYPQYCAATTASIFDEVSNCLQRQRWIPEIRFINQYYQRDDYIAALAASISESREKNGRGDKLVFSYHGIPKSYVEKGDPYYDQCLDTTSRVQAALGLDDNDIITVFQSRVGREEWLKPYCDETLKQLPGKGIKNIDIISPAFSADCLETLEELEEENRDYFMEAGGERYHYIPALNDRDDHLQMLASLVQKHVSGWTGD